MLGDVVGAKEIPCATKRSILFIKKTTQKSDLSNV